MNKFIFAFAVFALGIVSVSAQSTSATTQVTPTSAPAATPGKIGPAPAKSQQSKVLSKALSPETRKTLAAAMDAIADVDTTHPASAK